MNTSDQKIALVTGASRGLGAAMAEYLAANGHHVIALARTVGGLEELDDRIQAAGGSATLVPVDLTKPDPLPQICGSIFERWGKVDLFVHAAIHAAPLTPVPHMDAKDLEKSVALNVTAAARLIANVEALLKAATNGQAVFFDDPVASQRFHGAYGMTKAAQIRMAKTWQSETANLSPKVHVLTPNPMPTATRARFYPGEDRSGLAACMDEAERLLGSLDI